MKWSVTLTDRLGPEMLTVLEIKGQVLHRVRLHVKVPGLLLNLNALLTKKLPKFLSRLNEMSGGKENMCLVSGSLLRILKLYVTFHISLYEISICIGNRMGRVSLRINITRVSRSCNFLHLILILNFTRIHCDYLLIT